MPAGHNIEYATSGAYLRIIESRRRPPLSAFMFGLCFINDLASNLCVCECVCDSA